MRHEKSVLKKPSLLKQIVAEYLTSAAIGDGMGMNYYRVGLAAPGVLVWLFVDRRRPSSPKDLVYPPYGEPEREEQSSTERGRLIKLHLWQYTAVHHGDLVEHRVIHMMGKRGLLARLPRSVQDAAAGIIMLSETP